MGDVHYKWRGILQAVGGCLEYCGGVQKDTILYMEGIQRLWGMFNAEREPSKVGTIGHYTMM